MLHDIPRCSTAFVFMRIARWNVQSVVVPIPCDRTVADGIEKAKEPIGVLLEFSPDAL